MSAAELSVRCIEDEDVFLDLQSEWNRLAELTASRSIFLRHEWFDAAWQWARVHGSLKILCFSRADTLVGIVPLVLTRTKLKHLPIARLELLAVPDTQLADFVVPPGELSAVCRAFAGWLRNSSRVFDLLELTKIGAKSATVGALLQELQAAGFAPKVRGGSPNLLLRLDDSWERFYARRSRRLKKGNNLVRNRLEAEFDNISLVHSSAGSVDALLDDVVRISGTSWKADTGTTLDREGPNAFLRRWTQHALAQGWLSAFVLYLDGQPAAAEYQIDYGGDVYALRSDFDTNLERFSPGTYLNAELLKALFGRSKTRYLMGPGSNAYKLRWADGSEELVELRVFSRNPKARSIAAVAALADGAYKAVARLSSMVQRNQGKRI
jgi:CelD/BcsL family acetyltransferase involved in cellulose biosynthesis